VCIYVCARGRDLRVAKDGDGAALHLWLELIQQIFNRLVALLHALHPRTGSPILRGELVADVEPVDRDDREVREVPGEPLRLHPTPHQFTMLLPTEIPAKTSTRTLPTANPTPSSGFQKTQKIQKKGKKRTPCRAATRPRH
jgi:hypothetical protein